MKVRSGVNAMISAHAPTFHASLLSNHRAPSTSDRRIVPIYWIAAAGFGILAWSILFNMI